MVCTAPLAEIIRSRDAFGRVAKWAIELEEELKATREDYMEEIEVLVEKNDDLTRKLGVFMGDPAPGGEDDNSTCPGNYIIIDDTDSDPNQCCR